MQSLLTIFPVNNFARRENGNQSSDIGIPLYLSLLLNNPAKRETCDSKGCDRYIDRVPYFH